MKVRKVEFKVTCHARWYPVYEVPAHMTDNEALEHVQKERPDEVYDEYLNGSTYDQECFSALAKDAA